MGSTAERSDGARSRIGANQTAFDPNKDTHNEELVHIMNLEPKVLGKIEFKTSQTTPSFKEIFLQCCI